MKNILKSILNFLKKYKKIIILLIFILLLISWGLIIYKLSDMNTNISNGNSKGAIAVLLEKGLEFTNDLGITNSHPDETKIEHAVSLLNSPLRKVMHASVYFVLAFILIIIVSMFMKKKNYLKSFIFCLVICFIFAFFDEFHQTFVDGRTGQFKDVIIDTCGSILGMLFYGTYYLIYKLGLNSNKKNI